MVERKELGPGPDEVTATVTEPPSDIALVRRLPDQVASSVKDIRRGEMIFLDQKGATMDRKRFKRAVLGWKVVLYGGVSAAVALFIAGWGVLGASLYLAAASPFLYAGYRGSRRFLAISVLVRDGHLEEAQRRLDDAPSLRWRNRVGHAHASASLASHRGDYATAIGWWRKALVASKPGGDREIIRGSIARALALNGQLAEARLMHAEQRLPPDADPIFSGAIDTALVIGLCSHDPADLPPTETLHEWASLALSYSHTGPLLAMIGWAFDRLGDEEMADFLAGEVPDRLHYRHLKTWWPALQAWIDDRLARRPTRADDDAG